MDFPAAEQQRRGDSSRPLTLPPIVLLSRSLMPLALICLPLAYLVLLAVPYPLLGFPLLSDFSGFAHAVVWYILVRWELILYNTRVKRARN